MSIWVDHSGLKHLLKKLKDVLISGPADGQVLTYRASDKKWINKAPAAGGTVGKGIRVWKNAYQDIPASTWTVITHTQETFDDFNEWDGSDQFTCSATGRYLVAMMATFEYLTVGKRFHMRFFDETGNMAMFSLLGASALTDSIGCAGSVVLPLTLNHVYDHRIWHNDTVTQRLTYDTGIGCLTNLAVIRLF